MSATVIPKSVASPNQQMSRGVPNRIRGRLVWIAPRHRKVCARCRAAYRNVSTDEPGAWERLPFVGLQADVTDPDRGLELRNCTCGNTLAVEIELIREVRQ